MAGMIGGKVCLGTYDIKDEHLLDSPDTTYGEDSLEYAFNCCTVKAPASRMGGGLQPVSDNVFGKILS